MRPTITTITLIIISIYTFAQPESKESYPSKITPDEKTIFYKLGEIIVPIHVLQYGDTRDIACINLHSNETTSVQAATTLLELRGGVLIKIENRNQRLIRFKLRGQFYCFDPNRIFSRIGIEQSLSENHRSSPQAADEIEKFAQRLLDLIPESSSCILALHNNTDEDYSVRSYLAGNERESDAKEVYADSEQDVDDIAFTTDSILFRKMAEFHYNSILQDNIHVKRDGSLSVYCGEKNLRYINIETQHGKVDQYAEMMGKLLEILADEKQRSTGILKNAE